jgi:biotin operon repressor
MDQTAFNFDSIPPSDEAAVLALLREGRRAAVSSTEIERVTGLKPRRVQAIIRKLRLEGHNIGSATEHPMGYYITSAQDENADMARKLRARGIKVLMVAARFQKASLQADCTYQTPTSPPPSGGRSSWIGLWSRSGSRNLSTGHKTG